MFHRARLPVEGKKATEKHILLCLPLQIDALALKHMVHALAPFKLPSLLTLLLEGSRRSRDDRKWQRLPLPFITSHTCTLMQGPFIRMWSIFYRILTNRHNHLFNPTLLIIS